MSLVRVLLTFCCGTAYECGCVFWVHYSEKGDRWKATAWSMFNASVTIIGVEQFLTGLPAAMAYVVGFGTGTQIGMYLKERLKDPPKEP